MHLTRSALAAALAAAPLALAQTFTDCNPLEADCPNDTGYEGTSFTSDFTSGSGANTSWSAAAGTSIVYSDKGAEFVIAKAGQAPTIQTDFYIFFGKVEVVMQASPGTGIVSSVVLESDDLDEIDWEWLGGDLTQVESNCESSFNHAILFGFANLHPQTSARATRPLMIVPSIIQSPLHRLHTTLTPLTGSQRPSLLRSMVP